ncbi:hypothetical protein Fmac_019639 [Flemingia macrophylla]|uniref:Uncharacterized protein n=1 Tax=Flemingia macrophylla TaxID=520843 RepID=A0ABD1M941_9FABA
MQSMFSIRGSHGLPLCLSGIIHPVALSHEIADHDRRRVAMRKQRESMHANQEMGGQINFVEIKGETDLHDLSHSTHTHLGLIARAA